MSDTGGFSPEQAPSAIEILSQKIGILRSDSGEKRDEAARWLTVATAAAVATTAKKLPFSVGAPIAAAAVYKGYKRASESRDSATEASSLLALHQYDMFSQMGDAGDAPQPPSPEQPE